MLHLLVSPFGLGILAGAGGLWLYKKYETQTRSVVDDVVAKGAKLLGKAEPAAEAPAQKAAAEPKKKRTASARQPELN